MKTIKNPFENPLEGIINTFNMMKDNALGNLNHREDVLNNDIGTHIIDTVCTPDTHLWETGIQPKNKNWIIVQQYESKEEAIKKHAKWVKKLEKDPTTILNSIF